VNCLKALFIRKFEPVTYIQQRWFLNRFQFVQVCSVLEILRPRYEDEEPAEVAMDGIAVIPQNRRIKQASDNAVEPEGQAD
jgi:hypothetical protein